MSQAVRTQDPQRDRQTFVTDRDSNAVEIHHRRFFSQSHQTDAKNIFRAPRLFHRTLQQIAERSFYLAGSGSRTEHRRLAEARGRLPDDEAYHNRYRSKAFYALIFLSSGKVEACVRVRLRGVDAGADSRKPCQTRLGTHRHREESIK